MRAVNIGLAVGGLLLLSASSANAQSSTQIRPRVLLMVDTSGSMNFHLNDGVTTGGDGSDLYQSGAVNGGVGMLRSQAATPGYALYEGFETSSTKTCNPQTGPFDGVNSRLYAAKVAASNVISGSGDIDWGLMRYNGTDCAFSTTFNTHACTKNSQCFSGSCTSSVCACNNDGDCAYGEFCLNKQCGTDANLCYTGVNLLVGMTDTRNGNSCGNHTVAEGNVAAGHIPQTFQGGCGNPAGAKSATCATPETCATDADCGTGGKCAFNAALGVNWCTCTGGTCNAPWGTCNASKWCVYDNDCIGADGGTVLIDPNTANFSSNSVLPWINNSEIYVDTGGTGAIYTHIQDPELRANGGTPLAGAARAATQWYTNIRTTNADPKIACRPYVLVQLTDGADSCDADNTNGPVAAAAGFVAATAPGAKNPNKVYVIGLAFGSNAGPLDQIAQAGGTGRARLANSQQDIQAALADIVSSSVLHEVCNDDDDNCNDICDEDFPDVAVDNAKNAKCTPRAAKTCDNGALGLCHATGKFACSADQLSEVCVAPACTATPGATVAAGAGVGKEMRLNNVSGMGAGNVGQVLFVSGSSKVANNGGFLIKAVNSATSIDLANPGVVLPDPSSVAWAIPTTQGVGTTSKSGGNITITITTGSTSGLAVGQPIFVLGATNAANNGQFTITAVDDVNKKITFANAGGVAADTVTWAVDICKGTETCNGLDDDCDGVIDNCNGGGAGSCCTSMCPACAKAPFIETCNNCDDDCDGVIDDHLVDVGLACPPNDVGDCLPGKTTCCTKTSDPNGTPPTCAIDGVNDKIFCIDGNPGYPKGDMTGHDLCDGTDDNCNGVANDGPPVACFTDGTNTLPPGKDGVGVCHHGIEACTTLPLCGTSGVTPPNCIVGACPAGWPANKTCPNNTSTFGSCTGLIAPSTEFCDGLDNDCNACIDDNPQDSWLNTQCCGANGGNPLTDCDATAPGTMCKRGTWICAKASSCAAGSKQCSGSFAKSPEVCNGIDDDCNGIIDDVPGVGAPCTGPGIFTGGECTAVMKCVTNGQPPQCVQVVGPKPEVCNGKDDDCDGQIDEPPLNPNPPDPTPGTMCDVPMPPLNNPPCKPGTWTCVAGKMECDGAVGPMPNQCNGISTDCTGNPNTNGNCPTGFQCYQGNCVAPCQAGEFPCPGGYACNMNTTACDVGGTHNGCCVPDACAQITCPLGYNCQLDQNGDAKCVDPCIGVNCPPSYICKLGACVDGSCRTQGCPDGQICVDDVSTNMFECQPDPCANVMCDGNQFCKDGTCVGACAGPCPNGQYCDKGQCTPDPCAHTPCVEGQVCRVENGVGVCVENQCQFGCNIGQACCGGECVADQCENLHCPEDTHCTLTPNCQATCETNPASPKDQVVGAGGGGFGCAVAGHGTSDASSSLVWLLAVAGALLFRRRRTAEVRK